MNEPADSEGRASDGVIARLRRHPHRFTFVQAVRLWQREGQRTGQADLIGADNPPGRESVRLTAHQALGFQPGQVAPRRARDAEADGRPTVAATFMGLTGPNGALPQHYTELVIQRTRERDPSMRDFLDMFNHRLLSLFWRAAAKYRLDLSYERVGGADKDPVTLALLSVAGLGLPSLRDRLPVADEVVVHHGGHFSRRPPSAAGLEQMLSAVLRRPVAVEQFHGRWLDLPADQLSRLGAGEGARLGVDTVAGARVWDVQTSVRLRIGPETWAGFGRLQPGGPDLAVLAALTRLYLGPEFIFDVQVVLARAEVPRLRLGGPAGGARLGWNTWVITETPRRDVDDAVFQVRDLAAGT